MSSALPTLPSQPPLLELPAAVHSVGFAVEDYPAVLAAVAALRFDGAPEQAVAKRRAEFCAGRLAALHALRRLGLEAAPGRNPDGSPRWPAAVVGSITHGAERALCAVARQSELRSIGIDAERLLPEEARRELRDRICSPADLAALSVLSVPEAQRVSLAFSAKESLYKCLYPMVGRFMDFGAARVVSVDVAASAGNAAGELTLELSVDWSEEHRRGTRLSARFAFGAQHVETAVLLAA